MRYLYRVLAFFLSIALTWLSLYVLLDAQLLGVSLGPLGHVAVGSGIFALLRSISAWIETLWTQVIPSRDDVAELLDEVLPKLKARESRDAIPWERLQNALLELKVRDDHNARLVGAALADIGEGKQYGTYSAVASSRNPGSGLTTLHTKLTRKRI